MSIYEFNSHTASKVVIEGDILKNYLPKIFNNKELSKDMVNVFDINEISEIKIIRRYKKSLDCYIHVIEIIIPGNIPDLISCREDNEEELSKLYELKNEILRIINENISVDIKESNKEFLGTTTQTIKINILKRKIIEKKPEAKGIKKEDGTVSEKDSKDKTEKFIETCDAMANICDDMAKVGKSITETGKAITELGKAIFLLGVLLLFLPAILPSISFIITLLFN